MSDQLLARIIKCLEERPEVTAIWLAGSRGRGTNDEYSDIDIWVAIHDGPMADIADNPLAYVHQITPTIMHAIAPGNAPAGGAFVGSWVSNGDTFTQVDWYLSPSSTATRDADTKMVLGDVPVDDSNTPQIVDADERLKKVTDNLTLALLMVSNLTKHVRRNRVWNATSSARHADSCIVLADFWWSHGYAPPFVAASKSIIPLQQQIDETSLQTVARLFVNEIERIASMAGLSEKFEAPVSAARSEVSRWISDDTDSLVTDTGLQLQPIAEFYASLPRRRVGSGFLITNLQGDILLLETTYKPNWEIPGGHADAGESPRVTAAHEVIEELGLAIEPGNLLVIDHVAEEMPRGDILAFVYDGGVIADPTTITIDNYEIRAAHFVPLTDVHKHVTPHMARRLHTAVRARNEQRPIEIGSDMDDHV